MNEETMTDCDGKKLAVGDHVAAGETVGRVTGWTDVDGDMDDHGQSIVLWPTLRVEFVDGEDRWLESFHTSPTTGGWDEPPVFTCEDVKLLDGHDQFGWPASAAVPGPIEARAGAAVHGVSLASAMFALATAPYSHRRSLR